MKQEGKAKNLTTCGKHKETLSTLTKQIHFSQTRNVVLPPFCPRDTSSTRDVMKPALGEVAEKKPPRPTKWSLTLLTHSASPAPYAHPHPSPRRSWENCENSPRLLFFSLPPLILNAWSVIFCICCFVYFCLFSVQTNYLLFCFILTPPTPLHPPSQLVFEPSPSSFSFGRCDWVKAEGPWAEWG